MKVQIDKDLIEGLNESSNRHYAENVNSLVYELVANAVRDISEISPFVNPEKCVLVPANEAATGAFSQLSEYDYFFGIENKQIELNSKTRKNFWKFVWREFKASWRIGRKKYKKEKKNAQPKLESIEKYKLSDFQYDLTRKMADYLNETTLLFNGSNVISIVGKEDFGTNTKINIFVCCYDSKTDTFKLFNQTRNKYFDVCFGSRFELIELKEKETNGQFLDMLKIFNALFAKNYNKIPNQILLESLLYNVPSKLYSEDIYRSFVNVSNYLRISNPKNFVSICKGERNIFEEPLIIKSNSQVDFGKVITMLDNYKY